MSDFDQVEQMMHARVVGQDKDGGAAFGGAYDTVIFDASNTRGVAPSPMQFRSRGMSIRDWFAGQALQGLLACPTTGNAKEDGVGDANHADRWARRSYAYADAMLAERSRS